MPDEEKAIRYPLPVAEAALALNKSPATVRRMCERGHLYAQKVGRDWVVDGASPRILFHVGFAAGLASRFGLLSAGETEEFDDAT